MSTSLEGLTLSAGIAAVTAPPSNRDEINDSLIPKGCECATRALHPASSYDLVFSAIGRCC